MAPTSNEILALIRSVFLWGRLPIVIVVFAIVQFVRQRGEILPALRRICVTNWLLLAWQWLYRGVDKTRGDLSRLVTAGWQGISSRLEGKQILPPLRLIFPILFNPRREVYFYYLAMIRRGGEQGIVRDPSETPSEYAVKLEKAVPAENEDIVSLTERLSVKARYSRNEVSSGDASMVKAAWDVDPACVAGKTQG